MGNAFQVRVSFVAFSPIGADEDPEALCTEGP